MNTFGNKFRVSIFGESHGERIGVTLDGVLPGIPLSEADFTQDLARRKAGALGTTPRVEADEPEIVSGVYEGHTTGAPLTILFRNENTRSEDYEQFRQHPRPGHADFTANLKFGGFNDPRGGGHFSGRLTLGIVAAGVVAKKMLYFAQFHAALTQVGGIKEADQWPEALRAAQADGDSLGGIVECTVENVPIGLGEPFWNSVESQISHAIFAIPGVRGIEFGDGFAAAAMHGSEHNDPFRMENGHVTTTTNHSGGIQGGISNGQPVRFRVAFKPTPTIGKEQQTVTRDGRETVMAAKGRHDPCVVPRAVPVVESLTALVILDQYLSSK